MRKLLLFLYLGIFGFIQSNAQILKQVIAVSGGSFTAPSNLVRVWSYNPSTGNAVQFDSIPGRFTAAAYADTNFIYISADSNLVKYKSNTLTRLAVKKVNGIQDIGVYKNKLIVASGYGGTSYISILDKVSLETIATFPQVSGEAEAIAILGDTAYISLPLYYNAPVGSIAVIDLANNLFKREINLGTDGKGIGKLYSSGGKIYALNSGSRKITTYDPSTGSINSNQVMADTVGIGAGMIGNTMYMSMGSPDPYTLSGIGSYDVMNNTVLDSFIIDGPMVNSVLDHINSQFYFTRSDYFSYGRLYRYTLNGTYLDSMNIGLSPEAIALDFSPVSTLGIEGASAHNDFSVGPNPSSGDFRIFGNVSGIRILNISGEVVREYNKSQLSGVVYSGLSPGLYLISSDKGRTRKMIIQ